jgi:hypothetical protein
MRRHESDDIEYATIFRPRSAARASLQRAQTARAQDRIARLLAEIRSLRAEAERHLERLDAERRRRALAADMEARVENSHMLAQLII